VAWRAKWAAGKAVRAGAVGRSISSPFDALSLAQGIPRWR
jgi:hypothetical protein